MSSDLLEFDSYYKSPQETHNPPFPSNAAYTPRTNDLLGGFELSSTDAWKPDGLTQAPKPKTIPWDDFSSAPISNGQNNASNTNDNHWGDFESPSNNFQQHDTYRSSTSMNDNNFPKPGITRQSTSAFFDKPGMSRSSSFDEYNGTIADYIDQKQKQLQPGGLSGLRYEVQAPHSSTPEILFDADDEIDASFDDDDFGEFESANNNLSDILVLSPEKIGDPSTPQISNGELTLPSAGYKNNYPIPPKSPSFHERNPFSDLVLATNGISEMTIREHDLSTATSSTPSTPWPTRTEKPVKPTARIEPLPQEVEEEWGDFADLPPETPDVEVVDKTKANWSLESISRRPEPTTPDSPPPTNIPPPSILLPIFQQLFDLPRSALFQPVANQPFSLKNRILSDPSTIDFLRGYLLIAIVAARILAGRKLRWKRDHLLSQAMKIGLAGGKRGMKLTGIDKAESKREDREAQDTIQIWKEQLGRLRSAVVVANSSIGEKRKHLVIPELNEVMIVKSATVAEGAISDPKPCVLCGIKREERIAKVDIAVEDSFGDFWIQHWGHRDCRNLWREHSAKLRQR